MTVACRKIALPSSSLAKYYKGDKRGPFFSLGKTTFKKEVVLAQINVWLSLKHSEQIDESLGYDRQMGDFRSLGRGTKKKILLLQ
jgi:hypothetical protein